MKSPSSTSILATANGIPIETYRKRGFRLKMGHTSTEWTFLLARVTRPIFGADFLRHTGFLIDVCRKRLVQTKTWDTARLQPTFGTHQILHLRKPEGEYLEWIKSNYPDLLIPKFSEPTAKHGVVLQIPTTGRPVFAKARRLPPDKLAAAKSAFEDMSRTGVVRCSKSSWSSQLHMVPKEDGTWHPCVDFCCRSHRHGQIPNPSLTRLLGPTPRPHRIFESGPGPRISPNTRGS